MEKSQLLSDDQYRTKLKEFLEARMVTDEEEGENTGKLTRKDVKTLLDEPPLAFFVLFESAFDLREPGLRLGVLGSIIVAEVIYGAMRREPVTGDTHEDPLTKNLIANDLPAALAALSKRTYMHNYLDRVDDIKSMADLIEFVSRTRESKFGTPKFT